MRPIDIDALERIQKLEQEWDAAASKLEGGDRAYVEREQATWDQLWAAKAEVGMCRHLFCREHVERGDVCRNHALYGRTL